MNDNIFSVHLELCKISKLKFRKDGKIEFIIYY